MTADRGRVRIIALLWLLCQAGSLAAFVPENCCLSHAEEATARQQPEPCHEGEPVKPHPGDACPMAHANGAACPSIADAARFVSSPDPRPVVPSLSRADPRLTAA